MTLDDGIKEARPVLKHTNKEESFLHSVASPFHSFVAKQGKSTVFSVRYYVSLTVLML